jgi:hypothetical protein
MRTGLLAVRGLRSKQPAEASGSPRSLRSCAAAAACALAAVLVISRNAVPYSAEPAELFGLDLASPWSPAGGPPAPETSLARQMQLGRGLAVVESPIATSQLVSAAIRATRSERGALAKERQAEDGLETELAVAKRGNDGTGIFADASADPSTLSDKELRASIVRLEGNLKTLQGKHARKNMKPSLAREPSEAHEIGAVEPSETQELRAIQQTLKAVCFPSAPGVARLFSSRARAVAMLARPTLCRVGGSVCSNTRRLLLLTSVSCASCLFYHADAAASQDANAGNDGLQDANVGVQRRQ